LGARARGRANALAVGGQIGEAMGRVRIVLPLRIDVPPSGHSEPWPAFQLKDVLINGRDTEVQAPPLSPHLPSASTRLVTLSIARTV